jgi:hypothetical protein
MKTLKEGTEEFYTFCNFVDILKFGKLVFDSVKLRQNGHLLPTLPNTIFPTLYKFVRFSPRYVYFFTCL